ncbi:Stf0 family sulfotransferase [Rhodophyticola porphyridii]|uniref:Stf0 family sulfotransferase n=1 Tax=Rhodophyticola porphyridii TaxID=1852017 RepID=UPI0035CFE3F7
MAEFASYVICTSPRSGSTLLCQLLAATGVSGNPASYFHKPSVADWASALGLSPAASAPEKDMLADIVQVALAKGRRETGIFGLRLQRHSFDFFARKLAVLHPEPATDLQRFEMTFGRTAFIHLTRLDKVEQAVSCAMANQTGLWHRASDGTELERVSPPRPPVYDGREIREHHDRFLSFDREWTRWFDAEGIEPLRITYETLAADPVGTLRGLLAELGLNREAAAGVTPTVAKLADRTNHDWATRFRADLRLAAHEAERHPH